MRRIPLLKTLACLVILNAPGIGSAWASPDDCGEKFPKGDFCRVLGSQGKAGSSCEDGAFDTGITFGASYRKNGTGCARSCREDFVPAVRKYMGGKGLRCKAYSKIAKGLVWVTVSEMGQNNYEEKTEPRDSPARCVCRVLYQLNLPTVGSNQPGGDVPATETNVAE
jgi:hypothetical protein